MAPDPSALGWSLLRAFEGVAAKDDPTGQNRRIAERLRSGEGVVLAIFADAPPDLLLAAGVHVVHARVAREALAEPPAIPLMCSPDGGWFATADGMLVRLDRKATLRRLFETLVHERCVRPKHGISRIDLCTRVWPDERCSPESAANRLYYSVATLRALGLRPWLLNSGDGYLLDPTTPLDLREHPFRVGRHHATGKALRPSRSR